MTVFIWRLLSCISAGIYVVVTLLYYVLHPVKNTYCHAYADDEFIKDVQADNSKNSEYFTHGETRKYISKYVICKTAYDKYLVCNFADGYKNIIYFVMQYSKGKRVIDVVKVTEYETGNESKVIALNRRCAYVNVVVGTVNDLCVNSEVIRPLSVSKIRLFAFFKSVLMFTGLFVLRQVLQELATGPIFGLNTSLLAFCLKDLFNYLSVALAALFSLLNYFITVKCNRRKNVNVSGGNYKYDFV